MGFVIIPDNEPLMANTKRIKLNCELEEIPQRFFSLFITIQKYIRKAVKSIDIRI